MSVVGKRSADTFQMGCETPRYHREISSQILSLCRCAQTAYIKRSSTPLSIMSPCLPLSYLLHQSRRQIPNLYQCLKRHVDRGIARFWHHRGQVPGPLTSEWLALVTQRSCAKHTWLVSVRGCIKWGRTRCAISRPTIVSSAGSRVRVKEVPSRTRNHLSAVC